MQQVKEPVVISCDFASLVLGCREAAKPVPSPFRALRLP
jgi:hypothetical protein